MKLLWVVILKSYMIWDTSVRQSISPLYGGTSVLWVAELQSLSVEPSTQYMMVHYFCGWWNVSPVGGGPLVHYIVVRQSCGSENISPVGGGPLSRNIW